MNHKKTIFYSLLASCLSLWGCGGDKEKVETQKRAELNSPASLHALRQSEKIELRWLSQNVEDGFKGYYVFGTAQSWAELRRHIKFPQNPAQDWRLSGGIPFCKENNEFFSRFGLPQANSPCGERGLYDSLKDKVSVDKEEEPHKNSMQSARLPCLQNQEGALSLADSKGYKGVKRCLVDQVFDPKLNAMKKIVDGEEMTFFTVSVKGEGHNLISWTSNFVEGAGSKTLFEGVVKLDRLDQFHKLELDMSAISAKLNEQGPFDCPRGRTDNNNFCAVSNFNTEEHLPEIYITGDFTGKNGDGAAKKLRGFVSVPAAPANQEAVISIQSRGAETYDALIPGIQPRTPGGMPLLAQEAYSTQGAIYNLYGNQVFDLRIRSAKGVHFGKIVFESLSFSSQNADDLPEVKIKTYLIVQPGAGVNHYAF